MERKTGKNFDDKTAGDIFDKLKNIEGKTKSKKENPLTNISNLMNEAKYLQDKGKLKEAADLYKQVIFTLPDSQKAYEGLMKIYQKQNDLKSEKDLLMKAIAGCKNNEMFKKRLKEINDG